MDIVKPKFILFVKYEFWLNYLNEVIKRKKQYDLKCFLISSIFRKHQPFFKWYGSIFRQALAAFDMIFVQDKLSLKLLKKNKYRRPCLFIGRYKSGQSSGNCPTTISIQSGLKNFVIMKK
ncbi:MAG: hypothetical protein KatS3mg028_1300 [Bacteroidia bacterium]|nr:MAG: hypothetical protein KatS3mg028_1300 [Bacteroidia bacterium]